MFILYIVIKRLLYTLLLAWLWLQCWFCFYCGCMSALQKQTDLPGTIKLLMCHGMVSVSAASRGQNVFLWEFVGTHSWPLRWNYSRTRRQASNLIIYIECKIMMQCFLALALWLPNIIDLCVTDTQHALCNLISCDFKLQAKYFSANHLRVHLAAPCNGLPCHYCFWGGNANNAAVWFTRR